MPYMITKKIQMRAEEGGLKQNPIDWKILNSFMSTLIFLALVINQLLKTNPLSNYQSSDNNKEAR